MPLASRPAYRPGVPIEIRAITDTELPAWFEAAQNVFFMWSWGDSQAQADLRRPHMDLARTMAAFEGQAIVGTFRTFATELTVPGGRSIPASALTSVTVRSTHRRRGVLSGLMADDLAKAAGRGEPVGILLASEWPIYGRYGYGPATWEASWAIRTRAAQFIGSPSGSVEVMGPTAAREIVPEIFLRYATGQVGEIRRPGFRWDTELGIVPMPGRPKGLLVVAVHRSADGTPDGYAVYRGEEKWDEGIPDNVLQLDELHATGEAAEVELWRFLCSIDLVATIRASTRRLREPFTWHLEDARAARLKDLGEGLWLRIYDVAAALGGRAYETCGRLVIEVLDRVAGSDGPAAGRFELEAGPGGATCRPSRRTADLTIQVAALGAAYLGGTRLVDAVRAGGAVESTPGALARADALFRTSDEPWCTTHF